MSCTAFGPAKPSEQQSVNPSFAAASTARCGFRYSITDDWDNIITLNFIIKDNIFTIFVNIPQKSIIFAAQ